MNEAAMENVPWAGTLTIVSMSAVFTGRGGETTEHSHPAHLICFGGTVIVDGKPLSAAHTPLAIPAATRHQISASERDVMLVHLDARRFGWSQVERLADRWQRIVVHPGLGCLMAEELAVAPARRVDSRALAAVSNMAGGAPLSDVARDLGLSESRTTHLVREQLGASPRAWRSWLRLLQAVDLVAAGDSVTDAAYAAGFTDSSHFSRTCRSTLGLPPSVLRSTRIDNLRAAEDCSGAIA